MFQLQIDFINKLTIQRLLFFFFFCSQKNTKLFNENVYNKIIVKMLLTFQRCELIIYFYNKQYKTIMYNSYIVYMKIK